MDAFTGNSLNIEDGNGNVNITLDSELMLEGLGLNLATKNGRITPGHNALSKEAVLKKGPGQTLIKKSEGDKELNISVSVGNIVINK